MPTPGKALALDLQRRSARYGMEWFNKNTQAGAAASIENANVLPTFEQAAA